MRMRSGDDLGDTKMSKKDTSLRRIQLFNINCDRQKRFSQNEGRRADLQNFSSDSLIFAWGLSYDLSKFSDDFTAFFQL